MPRPTIQPIVLLREEAAHQGRLQRRHPRISGGGSKGTHDIKILKGRHGDAFYVPALDRAVAREHGDVIGRGARADRRNRLVVTYGQTPLAECRGAYMRAMALIRGYSL